MHEQMWGLRRLFGVILVAGLLTGCKSTALGPDRARAALEASLFAPQHASQTFAFVSGAVAAHPLALDQFLYAKRWLDCTETSPGAFSTAAVCRLNTEARNYGTANAWSFAADAQAHCERCLTVRVPVAAARLKSIDRIDALDKNRATVAFTYDVVPTEFGGQLSGWMREHPIAWCGPDPSAAGGWNAPRSGKASFARENGTWVLVDPAPGEQFDAVFAPPLGGTAGAKPCSA